MREGFEPVAGGCSSYVEPVEHRWCGWVDLNTNALITGFTKQHDSTHSVHKSRQGLVAAARFPLWLTPVIQTG